MREKAMEWWSAGETPREREQGAVRGRKQPTTGLRFLRQCVFWSTQAEVSTCVSLSPQKGS